MSDVSEASDAISVMLFRSTTSSIRLESSEIALRSASRAFDSASFSSELAVASFSRPSSGFLERSNALRLVSLLRSGTLPKLFFAKFNASRDVSANRGDRSFTLLIAILSVLNLPKFSKPFSL